MTLPELHAGGPTAIIAYLGWTEADLQREYAKLYAEWRRNFCAGYMVPPGKLWEYDAAGKADLWWEAYLGVNRSRREQTRKQFVMECLSALGIKGGTVEARRAKAMQLRPDLYQPFKQPAEKPQEVLAS